MITFVGVMSGIMLMMIRYMGSWIFNLDQRGYSSLNVLTMCIVMGLRQRFGEAKFDTHIPFITGNLEIPYQVLFDL